MSAFQFAKCLMNMHLNQYGCLCLLSYGIPDCIRATIEAIEEAGCSLITLQKYPTKKKCVSTLYYLFVIVLSFRLISIQQKRM